MKEYKSTTRSRPSQRLSGYLSLCAPLVLPLLSRSLFVNAQASSRVRVLVRREMIRSSYRRSYKPCQVRE